MGFTETWLKDSNADTFGINGYNAVYICRPHKKGGGMALYIKDLSYSIRKDLFYMNNVLETDKYLLGMNNNALIGVIYRPPDTDIELFNEMLNDIMFVLASENKSYYLLGDYNINLLNIESHSTTREFVDTMYTYSSFPNITKPTRAISCTLIDNIFSNDILTQYETISGLFDTDITDHFPIFHIVFSSQVTESKNMKPYRVINEKNMAKFQSRLATHEWNHILSSNDTQRAFTSFHDTIMQIFTECFPLVEAIQSISPESLG